jgi:hypothetical protein
MDLEINVDISGAIWRGTAKDDAHRYSLHVGDVLGETGRNHVRTYLPTQYMYLGHNGGDPVHNPVPGNAGWQISNIYTSRIADDMWIIKDPVAYGAWIEGTDARNAIMWRGRVRRGLSPRFPGYHTFRIIGQQLQRESLAIAERELPPYLRLMNT